MLAKTHRSMKFCRRQSREAATMNNTHWVLCVLCFIGTWWPLSAFSFCLHVYVTASDAHTSGARAGQGGESCLTPVYCCHWGNQCINYPDCTPWPVHTISRFWPWSTWQIFSYHITKTVDMCGKDYRIGTLSAHAPQAFSTSSHSSVLIV